MANSVRSIPLGKLKDHPDNANKQSAVNFGKLVRNIERTGLYEPLIVRPHPGKVGYFQIINGHHRCHALTRLGYASADCVVWEVNDEQTDVLLATLNRLGGTDQLGKKLKLLKRLNKRFESREMAKLLPLKRRQIERLTSLRMPKAPAKMESNCFANALVFFLDDAQEQIIEDALSVAEKRCDEKTKAERKAAALALVAQYFLDKQPVNCCDSK
jgi:ParB-like chromosome segregation protein Spo0J